MDKIKPVPMELQEALLDMSSLDISNVIELVHNGIDNGKSKVSTT